MEDLESVTGGELFERIIDQESFTEDRAAFFIRQVLEGLQYMHKKGVVHLDLKPENILLESGNRDDIKLIDFGLAQKLLPGKNITCKKGTPEFVAPELVKQQPVTKESDVWSVGVIAYILLSGLSPFLGDTDRDTLLKVKSSEWDFDDEVWDTISDDAKEFISKLLKEEPSDRLAAEKCLQHKWLKVEELKYAEKERARISTTRLKTFNSRRKWQRALTAVKSAIRICRLSSLTSIKNGSGKSANTTVTCTEEPILEGGTISKSIIQTAKTCSKDVPNKSTTNQENLKTGKVAGVIRDMERRISETDRGDFTNNTKGIDEYSNVACLENDCSDWIQTDNRLESSNLQPINKDIPYAELNACNCNVEKTNKESTLGEDTNCVHVKNESCVSHVDHVAIEDTEFVSHGNSTESNNVENCNTQHKEAISQIPLTMDAEPNTVVINASDDIGRTFSLKLESSHMVSGLTIESPAVISSVSSDTLASNCDAVTTLVGFFSENSSDSITEALPKAAADLQYGLLNQEKEPTLSYIDRNGNTGRQNGESSAFSNQTSKSNGESSAFASQKSKRNGENSDFASQMSKSNGENSAFASQISKSNGENSAFASQTSKRNGESSAFSNQTGNSNKERNVLASHGNKSNEEISTIASSKSSNKSTALASQRSKSIGDISAFVDQGNTSMRRRRLIKSLTIDQPNLDKQTSCATRRRIYSANDEIEPNSQESLDSVFTDILDDATTSRSSSSSDSTSRQLPSTRRTSTLFSISENEDIKKIENPSEANSPPSTTNKLIKRRSTYQKWSQESQDSIDVPINKKSEEFFSQMNTDIMAADAGRQSKSKKRRTGFAFQPGQDSIPANAFLNTSEEESPKMLSVAAVMMKLHMNRQTSRTPKTTDETDKPKTTERPSSKKITLTGQQRELSPQDIENNLDFLTISDDENLNFPITYKMWQLQNNKYANMVVGGLFGLFLGLLFRFIISIITDIIL